MELNKELSEKNHLETKVKLDQDPCLSGFKERRAFILRDAGKRKDSHKRRSNPRSSIRDSSGIRRMNYG